MWLILIIWFVCAVLGYILARTRFRRDTYWTKRDRMLCILLGIVLGPLFLVLEICVQFAQCDKWDEEAKW